MDRTKLKEQFVDRLAETERGRLFGIGLLQALLTDEQLEQALEMLDRGNHTPFVLKDPRT